MFCNTSLSTKRRAAKSPCAACGFPQWRTGQSRRASVSYTHLDVYKRQVRRGGKSVLTTISGDMAKAADYLSQSGMEPRHRQPGRKEIHPVFYGRISSSLERGTDRRLSLIHIWTDNFYSVLERQRKLEKEVSAIAKGNTKKQRGGKRKA